MLALKVESLSKRYRLGALSRRTFFRDWTRRIFGGEERDVFWALRDVSFAVEEGEVVGVLGRNGAGKSTLLKLIASITAPTTGRIRLNGRVASLLEVGTGFHLELTGRDNVFLNGAILGMSRRETIARFDEIVAFSGVEEFIDTPVKRYSSGMKMRLAFAVAAFLRGEILIVDEVLAVGDQAFQAQCLGKVGDIAREGRTVLFVSHNAAVVQSLCTRGIVLRRGEKVFDGNQDDAIQFYANSDASHSTCLRDRTDRSGTGRVRVVEVALRDPAGRALGVASAGAPLEVWLHFENADGGDWPHMICTLNFRTAHELPAFVQQNRLTGDRFGSLPRKGAFVCSIPRLPLTPGTYRLSFTLSSHATGGEPLDVVSNAAELHVEGGDFFGTGLLPHAHHGPMLVGHRWRLEENLPVA